jgi:hypothetical protein
MYNLLIAGIAGAVIIALILRLFFLLEQKEKNHESVKTEKTSVSADETIKQLLDETRNLAEKEEILNIALHTMKSVAQEEQAPGEVAGENSESAETEQSYAMSDGEIYSPPSAYNIPPDDYAEDYPQLSASDEEIPVAAAEEEMLSYLESLENIKELNADNVLNAIEEEEEGGASASSPYKP